MKYSLPGAFDEEYIMLLISGNKQTKQKNGSQISTKQNEILKFYGMDIRHVLLMQAWVKRNPEGRPSLFEKKMDVLLHLLGSQVVKLRNALRSQA